MIRLGFTGTRWGMTEAQRQTVAATVKRLQPTEAHHGDCIGADEEFHAIVRREAPACRIVVHPGPVGEVRAYCRGDEVRKTKEFMARNRDIVDETDGLVGAPREASMQPRDGTWSTIRYADRIERAVCTVLPGGEDRYSFEWTGIEAVAVAGRP